MEDIYMRFRLILLCVILFIAAGCSRSGDRAERVREHYSALGETAYTVTLRTDFGDRVLDFTVEYRHRPGGGGQMKVLSPELIAGIEAHIAADGVSLIYDGLMLEMGALPGTGLSPMESLPFIIGQWSTGYISQTGNERRAGRSLLTVTTRRTTDGEVLEARTWFDEETLKPVTAELSVNGFLTVTAIFE
jgi:outer membrane lipoprotein-sorting protein